MPTSATSPFEALPVELKTQILSSLSVSEILRVRRLNKHFRTLIDYNRASIFHPGQNLKLQELQQIVRSVVDL